MEFLSEYSTQYLAGEHSKQVRYQVDHKHTNKKKLTSFTFQKGKMLMFIGSDK